MRGLLGGLVTGGLVSVLGLGAASVMSEQPAGFTPPEAPLVEAPAVEPVEPVETVEIDDGPSTPVGSLTIEEPQAPDLPEGEAALEEPDAPAAVSPEVLAPRADTDPLDEPVVASVEGAMAAPDTGDGVAFSAEPVDPVLPNPQSLPPQTPTSEADIAVSTAPAQPVIVVEPETPVVVEDAAVEEEIAGEDPASEAAPEEEDTFVVDLGAATVDTQDATVSDERADADTVTDAPTDAPADDVLASAEPEDTPTSRLQLQGEGNSLLTDRDTGVTVRRPTESTGEAEVEPVSQNALADFGATVGDVGSRPLLSIILIDDGTMSAAAAALAGLPFPVTIALDPATDGARDLMDSYRAAGFEVAILAKLPEGALPSDVEVTFESIFSTLPETIAVLDIGDGGLQTDRAVTEQAMDILATQGRGFVTVSQGLNMAGRAAEQAGVPSVVVYRDLDVDGQDARVVRRFVDQAAFRARQESGVVLVGRVRPDTISALILWGTANQDDQVALVPVSAVLLGQ